MFFRYFFKSIGVAQNMTNYKLAIFDLDGTLVHSKPEYRYLVVGNVLRELGKTYTHEKIDSFWFETHRNEVIKREFQIQNPDDFWTTFKKHDSVELRKQYVETYSDVNFIVELKNKGIKTAIVTGAPNHMMNLETNLLGKDNFDCLISANPENGFLPKPDPQGIEFCLSQLGIDRKNAMYIGNGSEDVEAAKNANVFDVHIDRGEHKINIIPSLKINSLYELRRFF